MLGALLIALCAATPPAETPQRTSVALLPFTSEGVPSERVMEIHRNFSDVVRGWHTITVLSEAETALLMEQLSGNKACGTDEACLKRVLVGMQVDAVISGTIGRLGQNERVYARSVWKDGQVITSDRVLPLGSDGLRMALEDLATRAFRPNLLGSFIALDCQAVGLEVELPNGDFVRCPVKKEYGPFVATANAMLKVSAGGVQKGEYSIPLRATYSTGVTVGAQGPDIVVKVADEVQTPEGPGVPVVDPLLPAGPNANKDPTTNPNGETPPVKTSGSPGMGPFAWAGIGVGAGGAALAVLALAGGGLMGLIGGGLLASFPRYSDGRIRAGDTETASAAKMRVMGVQAVAGAGAVISALAVVGLFAAVALGGVLVAVNFMGQGE